MCGVVLRDVFVDKEYHVEGCGFSGLAWFRRKTKLHFVHHRQRETAISR